MRKLIFLALAFLPLSLPAYAQNGTLVGLLSCRIEGGTGYLIGSSKNMRCYFYPANNQMPKQTYIGTINKYGLDLGVTGTGILQWLVMAPTREYYAPDVLAGYYGGASIEATLALGLGAHAMLGGSNRTIALQPFSGQGQTGLNAALAVSGLTLVGVIRQ